MSRDRKYFSSPFFGSTKMEIGTDVASLFDVSLMVECNYLNIITSYFLRVKYLYFGNGSFVM